MMVMRKLFGTDGIRGKANVYPLTGDLAFKLGQAAAIKFQNKNKKIKVIIGKDTRRSGYIFEYALTSGLCSMGVDVYLVGPMPTPAIAHLVRSFAADAGIVISASHNPAGDNGIKFFDKNGFKLPDAIEHDIEKLVFSDNMDPSLIKTEDIGRAFKINDADGRYIEFCKASINNTSLKGLKIVVDCANGAAYKVAPLILTELGADVVIFGNKPDGININKNCGALYPDILQSAVLGNEADIGIALDGDADRVIMVDNKGKIMDGDAIMALCGLYLKDKGILKNDTIVGTVMSNMGLEVAMKKKRINFVRTKVGDRYVIEEMVKNDYNLGGEQAGHIILSDYNSTGDGTVTALQVLRIMKETKKKLSELNNQFEPYPQELINVKVKEKKPLEEMSKVMDVIKYVEDDLKDTGRVLVRFSGTENKCRVMVEGRDYDQIKVDAKLIVTAIKKEIGE
jgi:phosphoglucosamine mutase